MILNEIDRYAAAWLRNLFPGTTVDERSIADVQPADLAGHTRAHFFAGIGGWELALNLAGWPEDREVWTGSCPCQPFSVAGKAGGVGDERHLWPAFHRLIAERRPSVVFGEQVASRAGRDWLAGVRTDLEALGYAVGAADLCAASVGAPHVRARLWWVASMPNSYELRREGEWSPPAGAWDKQQFERLVQNQLQLSVPSGRLRALVDGVSNRSPKLRAYGNAIVPPLAALFVKAFMDTRATHNTAAESSKGER